MPNQALYISPEIGLYVHIRGYFGKFQLNTMKLL